MKASVYGFLAASILGLASVPAFAEDAVKVRAPVLVATAKPHVEVVALDASQAELLISERRKHQEALEKLNEEHKRAVEAILAATSR